MSAAAALVVSAALAGCGGTTYFAGRNLPPSGLTNRVMIAIQNPSAFSKGALVFVDAYYDIRSGYGGKPAGFSISGYSGALPISIQNMPEEQLGVVYGAGDGTLTPASYAKESTSGATSGTNGLSSSIFMTRNQSYVFAASQNSHVLTVADHVAGSSYPLSLPGVYRVSVNPGGSMAIAFVQNSNYAYYPVKLSSAQTTNYSGGPATWPKAAVDCEPQNAPGPEPRSCGFDRKQLRRAPGIRPPCEGCVFNGWRNRLYPQLRTRVRRLHSVGFYFACGSDDLPGRSGIGITAYECHAGQFHAGNPRWRQQCTG